jgi:hypothetical protein
MEFAVNLDNNKVVDNLLIYLVPNFHICRPNGLRGIAVLKFTVRFACSLDRIKRVNCLTLIIVESSRNDYKKVADKFHKLSRKSSIMFVGCVKL